MNEWTRKYAQLVLNLYLAVASLSMAIIFGQAISVYGFVGDAPKVVDMELAKFTSTKATDNMHSIHVNYVELKSAGECP